MPDSSVSTTRWSRRIHGKTVYPGSANARSCLRRLNQLCSRCRGLVKNCKVLTRRRPKKIMNVAYPNYATIKELKISAGWGCHLCSLFYDDSNNYTPKSKLKDDVVYRLEISDVNIGENRQVWFKMLVDGVLIRNLRLIPGTTSATYGVIPPSLSYDSTASEESFILAKRWLANCLATHDTCSDTPENPPFYPSRLLHMNQDHRGLRMRVCPRAEIPSGCRYIALSHCWGLSKQRLLLTSQSYPAFTKNIPIQDLSRNILDCALATLRLGFHYLWVDSLCILQDSVQDWHVEANEMGRIYRNCICSIAAATADHADGGCFSARNNLSNIACQLSVEQSGLSVPWTVLVPSRGGPMVSGGECQPLNRRGWVVQERVCAPRTLYYSSDIMHWECVQSNADEVHPEQRPASSYLNLKNSFSQLLRMTPAALDPSWHFLWWRVLSTYTRCALTFQKDKWIAISGLAHLVHNQLKLTLVAGHWVEFLLEDIIWRINPNELKLGPNGLRFCPPLNPSMMTPTWSWVSIENAVESLTSQSASKVEIAERVFNVVILGTKTVASKLLYAGLMPSITLKITSPLRPIRWAMTEVDSITPYHDYGKYISYHVLDMGHNPEDGLDFRWWPDYSPGEKEASGAHLLQTYVAKTGPNSWKIAGLVIMEIDSELPDRLYRRIGSFWFSMPADEKMPDQPILLGDIKSIYLV